MALPVPWFPCRGARVPKGVEVHPMSQVPLLAVLHQGNGDPLYEGSATPTSPRHVGDVEENGVLLP